MEAEGGEERTDLTKKNEKKKIQFHLSSRRSAERTELESQIVSGEKINEIIISS